MKKVVLFIIGVVLMLLSIGFAAGCDQADFPARIEVTIPPDSVEVRQGDAIDFTGCVLTLIYADESTETIGIDAVEVRNFDSNSVGKQSVELVYARDGRQISTILGITVLESDVISIEIEGDVQTNYLEGEYFSKEGFTVYANLENGERKEVPYITVSPSTRLTSKVTEVVLSYRGAELTIPVTVEKKAPKSLEIVTPPNKINYYVGDLFSPEGLSAKLSYNDGEEVMLASGNLSFTHYDGSEYLSPNGTTDPLYVTAKVSEGEITVRYDGLSIIPIMPTVITTSVTGDPLEYYAGEEFSFRGSLFITVQYNNGSVRVFSNEEDDLSIFSFDDTPLTVDQTQVKIWIGEDRTTYGYVRIKVIPLVLQSIFLKNRPTKRVYTQDETRIDPTGMVLTLHYENGTEEDLAYAPDAGITFSDIIDDEENQRTYVTIEYGGKSVIWEQGLDVILSEG